MTTPSAILLQGAERGAACIANMGKPRDKALEQNDIQCVPQVYRGEWI